MEAEPDRIGGWGISIGGGSMLPDDTAFAIHLAGAPIMIIHPHQDIFQAEHTLFHYRRAPEPKFLIVHPGPHSAACVGGKHLELAARESIAWFRRFRWRAG